jgi:hypothetical protein
MGLYMQDHGGPVGNDARRAQQPRTLIFWGQGDIFFTSRIQSDGGMAAGKGRGSDPTQNLRRPRLNS